MRIAGALGFFAAATFCASAAWADSLRGTRSEEVHERSHAIELRLAPGHAEMVVRRTIENRGTRQDQAIYFLDLPDGAVATGLRTLGYVGGEHRWFSGELMERDEAAKRYKELTGLGMAIPKDPALLHWVGIGRLGLQVFPIAPGSLKTVEYTLKLPTEYVDGRDVVRVPSIVGVDDVVPEIVVTSKNPDDKLFTDFTTSLRFCSHCDATGIHRPLAQGARIQMTGGDVHFALERRDAPRLGGRLASVPIRAGRALTHLRVETSRALGQVPRGARVVVLFDQSRSMAARFDAEIAAARATLSHFVDAEVEVVPFDRAPHPRYGKLVAGATAYADLAKLQLTAANGSNFDDALAKADAILAATPPGSARRVLLFTDLKTRSSLTPGSARGKLSGSGALLHVVDVTDGGASLTRDDEGAWAAVPRATGGLLWSATASSAITTHARDVFEELARPKRIDRLRFVAGGWPADALEDAPDTLAEGQGWELRRIADVPLRSLDVSGEIWAAPIRHSLQPDADEAKLWAALVFGSYLAFELEDAEMMTLAKLGGAVSPVTSYLAIEPGVRPSTEGLEEEEGGLGLLGIGEGGGGVGDGIGIGNVGTIGFDKKGWLQRSLAHAWEACGGAGALAVTIETTHDEIVDVRASASDKASRCLVEAAWVLELPRAFEPDVFSSYIVNLP